MVAVALGVVLKMIVDIEFVIGHSPKYVAFLHFLQINLLFFIV